MFQLDAEAFSSVTDWRSLEANSALRHQTGRHRQTSAYDVNYVIPAVGAERAASRLST